MLNVVSKAKVFRSVLPHQCSETDGNMLDGVHPYRVFMGNFEKLQSVISWVKSKTEGSNKGKVWSKNRLFTRYSDKSDFVSSSRIHVYFRQLMVFEERN